MSPDQLETDRTTNKKKATRERLLSAALAPFSAHWYETVSVAEYLYMCSGIRFVTIRSIFNNLTAEKSIILKFSALMNEGISRAGTGTAP